MRITASILSLVLLLAISRAAVVSAAPPSRSIPRYAHVIVIVDENKDYAWIMGGPNSPNFQRLAKTYGVATQFYAETHPSEPNYVALIGGDTFGIRDDDAYYCKPGMRDPHCEKSMRPGYVNHTIGAPNLASQLERAGLSWKGYYQSIPFPGSPAVVAGDPAFGPNARQWELYASKHSGFMNYRSVQKGPSRAAHIVGFDRFDADLSSGNLPAFALVVPNQCDDMHGLDPTDYTGAATNVPRDCDHHNIAGLIRRGDAMVGRLLSKIQHSAAWNSRQNVAVVITFDEGEDKNERDGGHIPTIVITNHGPRAVRDNGSYNHYSLLRTIEDAFGIRQHIGRAANAPPMAPLFTTR